MQLRRVLFVALLALPACGPRSSSAPQAPTAGTGSAAPVITATLDTVPAEGNDAVLPLWSKVKKGTLPNGLTYYIVKNAKPEQRAYLWLTVDAGSVQEDDDQRGLAHFTEHMLFNGTKRFPKAALVNYLESIGMDFGADLNAGTYFDQTIYKIAVPTDKAEYVTKGFEILRDFAGAAELDAAEIEKERGVVLEEWRLGRGAAERVFDKQFPVMMKGSKYADRVIIGLPETLKKAPREALVRFYKDWYRPDLMAVIAVGDFADPAAIEKQIQAEFGSLQNPAKPRVHPPAGVPTSDGPRVSIVTDKEMPYQLVQVYNLIGHRPEASAKDFRRIIVENLYVSILNERFTSIGRKPGAPFLGAGVDAEGFTREIDAFVRSAVVKGDQVEATLRSLFVEVLRVEKHGITQAEFDRAKTRLARGYDQNAVSDQTRESDSLADELTRVQLEKEFMVGGVAERDWTLKFLPTITLTDVNRAASQFGGEKNRVITLTGPAGKPLPDEKRVLQIIGEVEASPIEPWQETASATTLMATLPVPGAVTAETQNAKLGTTRWTLANGVKVIVKPTDFEADAVVIDGTSPGGLVQASAKEYGDARFADDVAAIGGAGELDDEALAKVLAGKALQVSTAIEETTESASAAGSVRDLEAMLQLLHLKITAPRKDAEAFGVWQANYADSLENQLRDPETQFALKAQDVLFKNHARRRSPTAADVKKLDPDRALAFYKDRFGDATDFTFVIVGAVDLATLKPLVERYLGSLPAKGRKEKELDPKVARIGGVVKKSWQLGSEPKASVQLQFHGTESYSLDKDRDAQILSSVLNMRLREVLREDMGGVYGVGTFGGISRIGRTERSFYVEFGCDPTRVDELVKAVQTEVAAIAKGGIGADYLEKVKQSYLRERERFLKTNGFWVSYLGDVHRYGDNVEAILDPSQRLARMTSDLVKASAKKFLDGKQYYQAVMLPAPGVKGNTAPALSPAK